MTSTVTGNAAIPTGAGLFALQYFGSGTPLDNQYAIGSGDGAPLAGTPALDGATQFYLDLSNSGQSQVLFANTGSLRSRLSALESTQPDSAPAGFGLGDPVHGTVNGWCSPGPCGLSCEINPTRGTLNTLVTCDAGVTLSIVDGSNVPSTCVPIFLSVIDLHTTYSPPQTYTFQPGTLYVPALDEPRDTSTVVYLGGNIHIDHLVDNSVAVYDISTAPWTLLASTNDFNTPGQCSDPTYCAFTFQGDGNTVIYGSGDLNGATNGAESAVVASQVPYISVQGGQFEFELPESVCNYACAEGRCPPGRSYDDDGSCDG